MQGSQGTSVGSIAGGRSNNLYDDSNTGRIHLEVSGDVAALFGIGIDINASIGLVP